MSNNKLYNVSYFTKRLKDLGYTTEILFTRYHILDKRKWTILLGPNVSSILITCYIINTDEYYFEVYDGGIYLENNIKIYAKSINEFIDKLYYYFKK